MAAILPPISPLGQQAAVELQRLFITAHIGAHSAPRSQFQPSKQALTPIPPCSETIPVCFCAAW